MTRCFCKKQLAPGDRRIDVALTVDWADDRGEFSKTSVFCSFACIAAWAAERAKQHDPKGA